MNLIIYLIGIPLVGGVLCLLIPKIKNVIAVCIAIITLYIAGLIFFCPTYSYFSSDYFAIDNLARFVLLAVAFFSLLIVVYSLKFMQRLSEYKDISLSQYYCYVLWTLGASIGVVLANNLILLLVFWGFLGLTLYLLIQIGSSLESSAAAKKTFIIIGGSDCLMILGIAIIWLLTETFRMDRICIDMSSYSGISLAAVAFLCLMIAAFAKAGAMPFHTWIPDMAATAPVPVTAYLPASLDKLLGIYLLARICMNMFKCSVSMNMVLMLVGAITILAAVFMAMVQHDIKKLLSYHAVSQVGYMVLGIGTGTVVGIAGGIFHMLNNTIYKTCLFLCGGSVEHRTGTSDLDKLGGIAKYMPLTFTACLIAALAISGVPPLNGFVSKWMIYQGIISKFQTSNFGLQIFYVVCLIAAMFGSALTLASFMKLIHGIFLGQKSEHLKTQGCKEVHWTMWLPTAILAVLCVIFGIFAFQIPLKLFIFPSLVPRPSSLVPVFTGFWQPGLATLLIIVGLIIGFIVYLISGIKCRVSDTYIGGEILPSEVRVTGVDFYQTIKDMKFFKIMYYLAEKKIFDIYDQGRNLMFFFTKGLQKFHTGVLTTYISWILVGFVLLLFLLVK